MNIQQFKGQFAGTSYHSNELSMMSVLLWHWFFLLTFFVCYCRTKLVKIQGTKYKIADCVLLKFDGEVPVFALSD